MEGAAGESDADLARRLAGGDRDVEAELYRRLAPRVRLYGLRHLRDAAAADDLVQDVLLLAFDSLRAGRVHDPQALPSFVLGTCRRVVADLRRGQRRREALLDRYGDALRPAPPPPVPPLDHDALTRCVEGLAPREKTIVTLSFFAERDASEIAEELGMTAGNVRVVRHRALQRVRACLEDGGRP